MLSYLLTFEDEEPMHAQGDVQTSMDEVESQNLDAYTPANETADGTWRRF